MKGRRGFLSGAAKMASAGGAALLLPRDALSELNRSGHLRDAVEEVYVEESFELSQEEIIKLLSRVKELEAAIANPTWFQGQRGDRGQRGYDGAVGPMGSVGAPGPQGLPGESGGGLFGASFGDNGNGEFVITDTSDYSITIDRVRTVNGLWPDSKGNVDVYDPLILDLNTQVAKLQDCIDYLMRQQA